MDSVLDVLDMHGKLRRKGFQYNWNHVQIRSELTGTAETIGRPESATIIRHVSADIWKPHEDLDRWREESRSCYLIFESLLSCNLSLVFV